MSAGLTDDQSLTPAPILEAVERYRGTITDLESGRVTTSDQFAKARVQLIRQLKQNGLKPGDRVLLALSNGPAFVAVLTSVLACDASPLLIHAQTPPSELTRYAQRFGLRFIVTEPFEKTAFSESLHNELPFDFIETALIWGEFTVCEASGPTLTGVPLHPTSGSTGLPKIGLRPGLAAMEEARHYAETMHVDERDCIMAFPPMSHAYGFGVCTMLPLLTGADIVTWKKFNSRLLQKALKVLPISILPAVPATIDMLSFNGNEGYKNLRWLLTAGSMLMGRSATRFRQQTGVTVCPLYGTTETGGISVATAADGRDIDGRVGPPMNGVEVEIWPSEDADLEEGIGKLYVRSSSMMAGYLDESGNITKPFHDGWFETGDLGRIEPDDTIQLRGRTSEMINVSGLKVVPCEVEEVILKLPGVREVKVYAGVASDGSQFVKASVAADPPIGLKQIFDHCKHNLVYYKRPSAAAIHLLDKLPRSPAGKILSKELP